MADQITDAAPEQVVSTGITTAPAVPHTVDDAFGLDFDPSQLTDAQLKEFLQIEEPASTAAPATANTDAEADAAGEKALADAEASVAAPAPAAAPPVPDPAKPADKAKPAYIVYDLQGKPIESLPIKEIELTIAGKSRKEPLEKIVRMAQSGGYNEQLQEEVKAARETVPQLQARLAESERVNQGIAQRYEKLLAEPDFWLKEVEGYAQFQSPEARATRAEQQLAQVHTTQQAQQSIQQMERVATDQIFPRLTALQEKFPTVQYDELLNQFSTLIAPYRSHGGGRVPDTMLPHVLDVIDRAIAPYAADLHDARVEKERNKAEAVTAASNASAAAAAAKQESQAELTKAKNTLARQIAPAGRVPGTTQSRKAKPVFSNGNQAADHALERALQPLN